MLPHTVLFCLAFTVRVAIRTPRVSGTGDARGISPYRTFRSNWVVQCMRVWSLPALLFLSEPICRKVGRRPDRCEHRGEATRPRPLRHPRVAVFPSVRGGTRRDARERPRQPPSAWFPVCATSSFFNCSARSARDFLHDGLGISRRQDGIKTAADFCQRLKLRNIVPIRRLR